MRKLLFFALFVALTAIYAGDSFARIVPQEDSQVELLYVTGPNGNPLRGAEDHEQLLHIDIPAASQGAVRIGVYDPDTGGDIDARESDFNTWDTVTEIALYGGKGMLYQKQFAEGEYDSKFYYFDLLEKTDGIKIGDFYRFILVLTAVSGDDANLFKIEVPDDARVSSPNITFQLLPDQGAKMHFYPLLKKGVTKIIVENYDVDEHGGHSLLHDQENNETYDINDSSSGQWSDTVVTFSSANERCLDYEITKATQPKAHAGLRITHMDDGSPVPIYFRRWPRSLPETVRSDECNVFTFDATKSFDPDNQALTYRWDFGDRTTSNKPIVVHRFKNGGTYNVILSVQDNSGLECDTAVSSQVIHVNTAPIAAFASPDKACTDQEVVFDAGITTDETPSRSTYKWDFGDGTFAEGVRVTKIFNSGGTYSVRLDVNDNSSTLCDSDSVEKAININTGPVAYAGADIDLCFQHNQDYRINFNGSGSMDADGDLLTYKWDFGDGSGAIGANVTHVYNYADKGEYVTTLFVDDGSDSACSASADSVNVKINRKPVAIAGDNITVCQGTEVLLDGSRSIVDGEEDLRYEWDFGDGTKGDGVKVAHTYEKGGNYNVVLTVSDSQNTKCSSSSDTILVTVNTGPSAVFYGVNIACVGDAVSFDAKDTADLDGDNLVYAWDFGDGTKGQNRPQVTHVYTNGGDYSVKLTVSDNKGTECSRDVAGINVRINTPPVADAGPNLVCCVNTVSEFDGSQSYDADGDSLSYTWDFGDGTTGEGVRPTHVYSRIGKYTVTLTVNDNSGTKCDTSIDSFTAIVNATPTSIMEVR